MRTFPSIVVLAQCAWVNRAAGRGSDASLQKPISVFPAAASVKPNLRHSTLTLRAGCPDAGSINLGGHGWDHRPSLTAAGITRTLSLR